MKRFKVYELKINNNIASGIIKGLIYRVTFNHTPAEKEAKTALLQAASYNIKEWFKGGIWYE